MKGNKGLSWMVLIPIAVLFISGSRLPAFSQPPGQGGSSESGRPLLKDDEPPPPFEKREEIRKRIELIRMWKLTEDLDLSEEVGAKLFPILHKYDEKRVALNKERHDIFSQLRKALENEASSDEAIEGVMEKLEKNTLAELNLIRQQRKELKGILTPKQQAKFILFQREFHREIRKIIAEARDRRVRKERDRRYDGPGRD
jgi:hypothetical protein